MGKRLMRSTGSLAAGFAALGLGLSLAAVEFARRREPLDVPRGRPAADKVAQRPAPSPAGGSVLLTDAETPRPVTAPDTLDRFLAALARAEDGRALEILEGLADPPDALDPRVLDRMREACRGGHAAPLRSALIYRLASIDLESLRGILPSIVRVDPEPEVRRAAIQVAAELRGGEMRGAILDAFADADPAVRADAVSALACLKDEEPAAFDRVAAALRAEPDAPARDQMAQALASLDDARVEPLLRELGLASAGDRAPGPKTLITD